MLLFQLLANLAKVQLSASLIVRTQSVMLDYVFVQPATLQNLHFARVSINFQLSKPFKLKIVIIFNMLLKVLQRTVTLSMLRICFDCEIRK